MASSTSNNASLIDATPATQGGSSMDQWIKNLGQLGDIFSGTYKTVGAIEIAKDQSKAAIAATKSIDPNNNQPLNGAAVDTGSGISTKQLLIGAGILVGVVIAGAVLIRMSK